MLQRRWAMRNLLVAGVAVLVVSAVASGEIPQVMAYQGRVTDNAGNPMPDGNYPMQFRVYDNATGSGDPLWDSGTHSVGVSNGVFSVMLGQPPHPALALDFAQDYWLLVTFDGENQTPLRPLGSAGYAYMASGLVPGTQVSGEVASGLGAAIAGVNSATAPDASGLRGSAVGGAGVTHGVYAVSNSTDGDGLFARATAVAGQTYGVYAQSLSPSGTGVLGQTPATTGHTTGVRGESNSPDGTGVWGVASSVTGWNYGVFGETSSSAGDGVHGEASATAGDAFGGYFASASTSGRGVSGYAWAATGTTFGVYGESLSSNGRGVYGRASANTGDTYGVYGRNSATVGAGVMGVTDTHAGLDTSWCHGVWGQAGGDVCDVGCGVYYTAGLAGTGYKSCVVKTSQGPTLLYCQESPECWFEDFGEEQLMKGRAHVELDPLFLETVTIDESNPMRVFVQLRDDCRGTYVKPGTRGFDVVELQGGTSSARFAYRVAAKRRGFEEKRLDFFQPGTADPYLYPELRGRELRELDEERAGTKERQPVE
jgi:hypothetical protein